MTETGKFLQGEQQPCDGCRQLFAPEDLAEGPLDTRWCSGCRPGAAFDCIQEDDGEP